MASIRLFGRGKSGSAAASGAGASGGAAVDADMIAAALADLSTAAVSVTWRCRHASGTSIGEGAVDFGAHRSRATVIRGKRTFEYVRNGSSVYRALLPEDGGLVAAQAEPELEEDDEADELDETVAALDEDEDGDDADSDPDDEDGEGEEEREEGADEPEASDSSDSSDEDDEEGEEADASDDDEDDEESGEPEQLDAEKELDPRAWQTFSENDVCGPHSYAEPAVLAQAVRRAGAVQARRAEEIDGVMLSAFSVTAKPKPADPDKLLARLARQLRDHGANAVVVTAFVAEDAEIEVGDAEDDDTSAKPRIVRLRLELPHWTPADDPTADHSVSVDLYELGDPVEIELPDRDRASRRTSRTCADLSLF